ncbi:MAG: cbb3-type cytochrome c oxidase subunit I, partial [Holophagae bacterium]
TIAHAHLGVYSFFSMVMFGSIYYIVPRLTGREWPSAALIKAHFWLVAVGMVIYWVALTWGGWYQGLEMNNPDIAFIDIVRSTIPYLWSRTFAGVLMTAGHVVFAISLWLVFRPSARQIQGPTLFRQPAVETGGEG